MHRDYDAACHWITAIRLEYIMNSEYDDLAPDEDNITCKPCFEENEEGIKATTKKAIDQPTAEEIEVHEVSHVPVRSWCKFCITGKG